MVFLYVWFCAHMCVHVKARSWQPLSVFNHCPLYLFERFSCWTWRSWTCSKDLCLCLRDSDSPELTSSLSIWSVAYLSLNLQDCLAISLFIEPFLQFLIFNCFFFFNFKLSSITPIPVYIPSSAEGFPSSNSWPALVISYTFELNALQQIWSDVLLWFLAG